MSLRTSSVLISLEITQWTARKLDRAAGRELCESKSAQTDAARVNKVLINPKHLKPIARIVNSARNFHYANTLPWEKKGADILPSAMYFEYMPKIGELRNTFHNMVNEFVNDLPTMIEQRERELGEMFNPDEYPTAHQVRDKFSFEIEMNPIPTSSDFRVDIPDQELEEHKKNLTERMEAANKAAEHELFARMYQLVAKVVMTLIDPGKIFRNTLILNPMELARKASKMNVNNNADINKLATELDTLCSKVTIDALRDEEQYKYRKDTAALFQNMLTDIENAYNRSINQ